jgi:hypothetical protein
MAKPNDSKPYPPELIRRVLSDIANEGIEATKIADLIGVIPVTLKNWTTRAKVKRGVRMTDEQIEEAIQICLNSGRKRFEELGTLKEYKDNGFRTLTTKQQEYVEKGFNATDVAPPAHTKAEAAAFAGVLACVERQLNYLEQTAGSSETIQDVTAAIVAGIGLKQLKAIYIDPPKIDNWKDVKTINDMVRESLGMNRKQGDDAPKSRRVDTSILQFNPNATKTAKGVTLDVEALNEHVT